MILFILFDAKIKSNVWLRNVWPADHKMKSTSMGLTEVILSGSYLGEYLNNIWANIWPRAILGAARWKVEPALCFQVNPTFSSTKTTQTWTPMLRTHFPHTSPKYWRHPSLTKALLPQPPPFPWNSLCNHFRCSLIFNLTKHKQTFPNIKFPMQMKNIKSKMGSKHKKTQETTSKNKKQKQTQANAWPQRI